MPMYSGRYILVLTHDGKLSVMCGMTGIILREGITGNKKEEELEECLSQVLDVTLIAGDQEVGNHMLLLLLKDHKDNTHKLKILSIPGFECIYELAVSSATHFLDLGEGAESIVFLEPEVDADVPCSIKVKSIVDGVPEARLAKLLRKHKFEEGEEFCERFGLPIEDVHKARARFFAHLVNPWNTFSNNTTAMDACGENSPVEELLLSLGKITDSQFVTSLCIEAPLPDISTTKRILNYAKERLANTSQSSEGDQLSELMQRVSESVYRLRTFATIFPISDIQHWLAFSNTDMLEEFIEHLTRGNLEVASTVWHRHQYEFRSKVDQSTIEEILDAVPHTLPSETLCSWLRKGVLADFVMLCPAAIEVIAHWAHARVTNLEISESSAWPDNGLKMANTVIEILDNVTQNFQAGGNIEVQMAVHVAQWKAHFPASALYQLRQTSAALHDLVTLARDFRVKIKFTQYTQENKEEVVAALLDWLVCGEEVAPILHGFLGEYLLRHGLDQDQTLCKYVMDTLSSSNQDWWAWEEAPWEDKLYAIIKVMSNAQVQADCIYQCVYMASVPWSAGTNALCDLGLSLNTSQGPSLEEQRRLVGLKIVLRRYNLHLISIHNKANGELMLHSIVRRDGDTVMEDALQVVSTYKHLTAVNAYHYRILHLVRTGCVDEALSLLKTCEEPIRAATSLSLLMCVEQILQQRPLGAKSRKWHKQLFSGMLALESVVAKYHTKPGCISHQDIFATIRTIHSLQEKYEMYLTIRDLEHPETCKKYLQDYIKDHCVKYFEEDLVNVNQITNASILECSTATVTGKAPAQKESPPKVTPEAENKAYLELWRLSSLLGVSFEDLLSILASTATEEGRLEQAVIFCKSLLSCGGAGDYSEVVYKVIGSASQKHQEAACTGNANCSGQSQQLLVEVIRDLLARTLAHIHPDSLPCMLELSKWCNLGVTLYQQCHEENVYNQDADGATKNSSDPYSSWKMSAIYMEGNMPIEVGPVTAMVMQGVASSLDSYKSTRSATHRPYLTTQEASEGEHDVALDEDLVSSIQELIRHLRDRSQDMMALIVTLMVRHQPDPRSKGPSTEARAKTPLPMFQHIFTLLLNVIGAKRPDINLSIALLSLMSRKEILKVINELIKRFGYDYARLQSISKIGIDVCGLYNLKEAQEQFGPLLMRANWGRRLAEKYNIGFREAFKGESVALTNVLAKLVAHKDCTFSVISDYCSDFNMDMTDALLVYLRTTLQSWEPQVPPETVPPRPKGSLLKIEQPKSVVARCTAIMAAISNKTELVTLLTSQLLEHISSYNYEMLELILQQLQILQEDDQELERIKNGLDILSYLKVYARRKPPKKEEIEIWTLKYPHSSQVPEIAAYRLPFHTLFLREQVMKIIDAELDISTIDIWLRAANTVNVGSDQLCFIATKNTVDSSLEKDAPKSPEWQVLSTNGSLLARVQTVVGRIQHLKLAAACARWVVQRLPPGADKVEAAVKAMKLGYRWESEEGTPEAIQYHQLLTEFHQKLAIEHSLHRHKLAHQPYLGLLTEPVGLIFQLYQHPALNSLATLATQNTPDINACVTEICNVVKLNQMTMQWDLLKKWLPPTEDNTNMGTEETVTNFKIVMDPGASEETFSQDDTSDDASLSRLIYLLRCCPQREAVSYLWNRTTNPDTGVSNNHRLRALRCMLAVADAETIKELSGKSMPKIRSHLQTLTYVSRLEAVGHTSSVSKFDSMDKGALVEGIWRSQRHNPLALTLLTDLCYDYQVTSASLWSAIITQLISFVKGGKIDVVTLERVLIQVKNLPHLWVVPAITTAWTLLINYPFTKASLPMKETALTACVHALDLLLRHCPVVVQTQPLLKHCQNLQLYVLALTVAAQDHAQTHDLHQMAQEFPKDQLTQQYHNLKVSFAFPRNVDEALESIR